MFVSETWDWQPISAPSRTDMVEERIAQAIIAGGLKPGEHLSEFDLAKSFSVSRVPIREALHRLEHNGLVTSVPNRGRYVWSPSESDVDEILSLRLVLEVLSVKLTIDHLVEDDFQFLEQLTEEQIHSTLEGDITSSVHCDRQFHEFLCAKTGFIRLLTWWRQIMGQWQTLVFRHKSYMSTANALLPEEQRDHPRILAALRKRDLCAALTLLEEINVRVKAEMKAALRTQAANQRLS